MSLLEPDDKRGVSRDRNGLACVALVPLVMGNVLSLFGAFPDGVQVLSVLLAVFAMYEVAPRRG